MHDVSPQAKDFGNIPEENWQYDDYRKNHPELPSPLHEPDDWSDEFYKRRGQFSTSGQVEVSPQGNDVPLFLKTQETCTHKND